MKIIKAGESHGRAVMGILTDVPAGITVSENSINNLLAERSKAFGRSERQLLESDRVDLITGLRDGKTIGNNVGVVINNAVHGDYATVMHPFNADMQSMKITALRPGHADIPGVQRFGFSDARSVLEGASARNTAVDVALGAIAISMLDQLNVNLSSFVRGVGNARDESAYTFEQIADVTAPFFSANEQFVELAKAEVEGCKNAGDSLGGRIEIRIKGIKAGFGSYVAEKRVDSLIAQHIMQIQAVKGLNFGSKSVLENRGSAYCDRVEIVGDKLNVKGCNSGGIDGGMTNGGEIVLTVDVKPIPTVACGVETIDIQSKKSAVSARERADVTAVFALCPILKSAVAVALCTAIAERIGCDNMQSLIKRYNDL